MIESSCLRSAEGASVPLMGVAVEGEVFGAHSRVVVRQRYKNTENTALEAIYTFPLPSSAVLVAFIMEVAGRRIDAVVKEREAAFRDYDNAISAGHGAALLDQERPNVFTANVGNLLPGEETIIEVVYVQELTADEGALRVVIPTLVAPRYMPGAISGDRTGHGAASPTTRVPDADRISPQIGRVSYGLRLDLTFDLGRDVTLESPSHAISTTRDAFGRQRVSFAQDEVALDRDVVLVANGAAGVVAGAIANRRPGSDGTFALTVIPDLFDPSKQAAAHDVVFLVDVSGSMEGASIVEARTAMALCLRHLREGDRFEVLAFSSSFTRFSERIAPPLHSPRTGLVPFTQQTLEKADRWVSSLQANGGTELLEPVNAALATLPATPGRDRLVVLITDGQVGNEAEILGVVKAGAQGTRFYTFGIGTNVSDYLLSELAKITRGAVESIHPGERVDDKVTAQFARALAARVEGVSVSFTGLDAGEIAPSELPDLVDGTPWVVYGRYSSPGIGRAQIRGQYRGERFLIEVPIDLPDAAERQALDALWAGARIKDLERAEIGLVGRRLDANRERIIALSVEHQVASKYASFVVVERRGSDRRAMEQAETRAIPVNAPAGWSQFSAASAPIPQSMTRSGAVMRAPGAPPMPRSPAAFAPPSFGGAPPPPPAAKPSSATLSGKRVSLSDAAPPAPSRPLMERAKDMLFGRSEKSKKAESADMGPAQEDFALAGPPPAPAFSEPAPAMAMAPSLSFYESAEAFAPVGESQSADGLRALFAKQLASGLWEAENSTDAGRLLSTARALARCHAEGIDTSHSLYGAQVKKAVEAICAIAGSVSDEESVVAALAAAYLVSSGPRLRARIAALITASASSRVKSLGASLASAEQTRAYLPS
jgi:Ca-activated chloride channel family protein